MKTPLQRPQNLQGHEVYNFLSLKLYDWWVLGVSNAFAWKFPTQAQIIHYRTHISPNHLEVGVGTGYFLGQTLPLYPVKRLALMDLSESCLKTTRDRLASCAPKSVECYQQNLLNPWTPTPSPCFDSIGMNYVLHCLPGGFEGKASVLKRLSDLLTPTGTLFGSTLLPSSRQVNFFASLLLSVYNRKGIFSNREDSLGQIQEVLQGLFAESSVIQKGYGVLFHGRMPRNPGNRNQVSNT